MRGKFLEENDGLLFPLYKDLPAEEIERGICVRNLSAGTVHLRHLVFESGTLIPDHRHPEEVVTMILEGTMEMTVGDETREVTVGDVFRFPPKNGHSGRVFSERVVAVLWSPIQ